MGLPTSINVLTSYFLLSLPLPPYTYNPRMAAVALNMLNPDAPIFLPEAHRKVCDVISRFFKANAKKIMNGIGLVCDGEHFPEVNDPDGRVWMQDETSIFSIQLFVPFETEPPKDYINERRITNRINYLMRNMSCDIDDVKLTYCSDKKQMIIETEIYCCEG